MTTPLLDPLPAAMTLHSNSNDANINGLPGFPAPLSTSYVLSLPRGPTTTLPDELLAHFPLALTEEDLEEIRRG